MTTATDSANHALIDPKAHPDAVYRVDSFSIPATSRADFEAAMQRNLAFLKALPGFLGHVVFEKHGGPTSFDVVTVAAWANRDAIERAAIEVRGYYARIGFDMPSTIAQWGVKAEIGTYRARRE